MADPSDPSDPSGAAFAAPSTEGKSMYVYDCELTDTFSGAANYSWVRRAAVKVREGVSPVRQAKKALGITGMRCKREEWEDTCVLTPYKTNMIAFITYQGEE